MSTDTSLITFKAISNFINDLGEVFSDKHRPLKLYAHLLNKTTIAHDKPIQKHIEAFRLFCTANRDAIANRDIKAFNKQKISYSKRVFINMNEIFQLADAETRTVIWKHLLTVSALVDHAGKARQILKDQSDKNGVDEADFLTNIISRVEDKVDPNANPMDAISSIMQSGIFTDLVQGMGSGLQDGSLDLGKLMSTVQNMVTKLGGESSESKEGAEQAINMIGTMMGSMKAGQNASGNDGGPQGMPDIAGMLGPMMGAMMGGQGGMPNLAGMMGGGGEDKPAGNAIEAKINAQVMAARASGKLPAIEEVKDE